MYISLSLAKGGIVICDLWVVICQSRAQWWNHSTHKPEKPFAKPNNETGPARMDFKTKLLKISASDDNILPVIVIWWRSKCKTNNDFTSYGIEWVPQFNSCRLLRTSEVAPPPARRLRAAAAPLNPRGSGPIYSLQLCWWITMHRIIMTLHHIVHPCETH